MSDSVTQTPLSRQEYDRMWHVLDLSLTAHSSLRDRYRRREVSVTVAVMALSILATGFAFVPEIEHLHIGPITARLGVWLGILTSLIFFLALLDLTLDWRRCSWAHDDAARRLGVLKGEFRAATVSEGAVDSGSLDLRTRYEEVMAAVRPIPERQFLRLKAKHARKIVVSKLIDSHPGAPLVYLHCLAMWQSFRDEPADEPADKATESIEEPPL